MFTVRSLKFATSIYLDSSNSFHHNNPQIPNDQRFHTFLLNGDKKILLVGDPVKNEKINKLFQEIVADNKKQSLFKSQIPWDVCGVCRSFRVFRHTLLPSSDWLCTRCTLSLRCGQNSEKAVREITCCHIQQDKSESGRLILSVIYSFLKSNVKWRQKL